MVDVQATLITTDQNMHVNASALVRQPQLSYN